MALAIPGTVRMKKKPAAKPVTLQTEQKAVATPQALQTLQPAPKAPTPTAAPSAPRETVPAAPKPVVNAGVPAGTVQTAAGQQVKAAAPTGPAMTTFSNQPAPPGAPQPLPPGSPAVSPPSTTKPAEELGAVKTPGVVSSAQNAFAQKDAEQAATVDRLRGLRDQQDQTATADRLRRLQEQQQPAEQQPSSNEQFDENVRKLMDQLLSGQGMDVNTAEEEALIKQLMEDRLGQGLVEQRARMGRAGFGASGALAAMEGDIRRQAGQQATQETLGLRRQAEQEAIDNALRAIGVDVSKRQEGRQSEFDQQFLDALKSAMGQETAPQGGTNPLDEAGKLIDEKGLIQGIPELAGQTFEAAVKALYGPDANPADYTLIPVPPFILPILGGAKGPIGQTQSAIMGAMGVK